MNKLIIVIIIGFLVVVYIYTFIKISKKRKKSDELNSVEKFHEKFNINNDEIEDFDELPRDYYDKDELIKVVQSELHQTEDTGKKRTFTFKF